MITGINSQIYSTCVTPIPNTGVGIFDNSVDASIINLSEFSFIGNNTYAPLCGTNSINFQLTFPEEKSWCGDNIDAEYRIHVKYRNFSCFNGQYITPSLNAYDSGPIGYNANNGFVQTSVNVPNIMESTTYYVEVQYRLKKVGCNVWKDWEYWYNSEDFIITEFLPGNTDAEGILQFPNCVNEYPSYYVNVDVAKFAPNDNIILNTTSSIGDWYSWEVFEFDLSTWQKIPGTEQLSPIVTQPFGYIHLDQFYSAGFDPGKIYGVSLNVGACWNSEAYFFEVGPVMLDVDLINNSTRFHTVGTTSYLIEQACLGSVLFDVRDTECEKSWSISLTEVNNSLQPINSMYFDSGNGDAGTYINLNSLWGGGNFQVLNKIYRLQYTVSAPNQTEVIYFEFKDCGVPKPISPDDDVLKLSLFPNPASDYINVKADGIENFEIHIYNITGDQIYSRSHSSNQNSIDVSDFPRGEYILNLISEGNILSERFLKQ